MRDAGCGMRNAGCAPTTRGSLLPTFSLTGLAFYNESHQFRSGQWRVWSASRIPRVPRPASRVPRPAPRARLLLLFRLLTMLDDIAGLEEDVLQDLPP